MTKIPTWPAPPARTEAEIERLREKTAHETANFLESNRKYTGAATGRKGVYPSVPKPRYHRTPAPWGGRGNE